MLKLIILILLISLTSAIEVNLNCPDDIYVDEEFECDVNIEGGSGTYDLKIEADKNKDSVLKILCPKRDWISGYYYLTDFIKQEENVKLKISDKGEYNIILKLRQDDKVEAFDVGQIKVKTPKPEEKKEKKENPKINHTVSIKKSQVAEEVKMISLNGEVTNNINNSDKNWDYISKDGKIIDWLPYGLVVFMVFLVGVMSLDRFRK